MVELAERRPGAASARVCNASRMASVALAGNREPRGERAASGRPNRESSPRGTAREDEPSVKSSFSGSMRHKGASQTCFQRSWAGRCT